MAALDTGADAAVSAARELPPQAVDDAKVADAAMSAARLTKISSGTRPSLSRV